LSRTLGPGALVAAGGERIVWTGPRRERSACGRLHRGEVALVITSTRIIVDGRAPFSCAALVAGPSGTVGWAFLAGREVVA